MQGNQRRGRRPIVTTLISEHRVPGGREFLFSSCDPGQDTAPQSRRALQTARAFTWQDDLPASNDPAITPGHLADRQANPPEADFSLFLRALRGVYRAPRGRR